MHKKPYPFSREDPKERLPDYSNGYTLPTSMNYPLPCTLEPGTKFRNVESEDFNEPDARVKNKVGAVAEEAPDGAVKGGFPPLVFRLSRNPIPYNYDHPKGPVWAALVAQNPPQSPKNS